MSFVSFFLGRLVIDYAAARNRVSIFNDAGYFVRTTVGGSLMASINYQPVLLEEMSFFANTFSFSKKIPVLQNQMTNIVSNACYCNASYVFLFAHSNIIDLTVSSSKVLLSCTESLMVEGLPRNCSLVEQYRGSVTT